MVRVLTGDAFEGAEEVVAVSALRVEVDPGRVDDARLIANAGRVTLLYVCASLLRSRLQ